MPVKFAFLLTLSLAAAACDIVIPGDPCGENGVYEGTLVRADDTYYDEETGTAFAKAGDGVVAKCTKVTGNIVITGRVFDNLADFDNIEEVFNIIVVSAALPTQTVERGSITQGCGRLGDFKALKRVEGEIDSSDNALGCMVLGGFEELEYVGGNLECGPNLEVGRSLRHVGGTLRCNFENLARLEYVGELPLTGGNLPNLKFAGRVGVVNTDERVTVVDLSSLESVGPIPHGNSFHQKGGLFIEGNAYLTELRLGSLVSVDGDLSIMDNGGLVTEPGDSPVFTEAVWEATAEVSVTESKLICSNGQSGGDPCPWDDDCGDVYGEESARCCYSEFSPQCCYAEEWMQCLEEQR